MFVTLFVDAGYDHKKICSGWGMWLKSDRLEESVTAGGWTVNPIYRGSTQAEIHAVLASISLCLEKGWIEEGDTVLVQSDCKSVAGILDFTNVSRNAFGDVVRVWMRRLLGESRLKFRYKHVEGHKSPFLSTRHGVNNLVDQIASKNLNKARQYAGG